MIDDDPTLDDALPATADRPDTAAVPALEAGDRVGNYVIREQIGEGGFAVVDAAEQQTPVRRSCTIDARCGFDSTGCRHSPTPEARWCVG